MSRKIGRRIPLLIFSLSAATGACAGPYSDYRDDAPGTLHKITLADLPSLPSKPAASLAAVVAQPAGVVPKVPSGFSVAPFAKLDGPRQIRVAPNGDVFVAETDAGRIQLLRTVDGAGAPVSISLFAEGLDRPFGIAFYPNGPDPKWIYVANNNSVVRFAYHSGDKVAANAPEVIVPTISGSSGGHITRDIVFSADDKTLLVSVGSSSNLAETMPQKSPAEISDWEKAHGVGASWGKDTDRADILAFDPNGGGRKAFATGIRNCVSMALQPVTSELWCVTNERDMLGDDLPPDYATRVRPGEFFGWPWYYIGAHQDPRKAGERPDLADKITVPNVLIQPHSAPLGLTFYTRTNGAAAFAAKYRGDAFVALHGSWNRAQRTGYKVIRVTLNHGVPTGAYEDFLVGFVVDDGRVWGRPVGVAVAKDGALLVTDDASNTVWRIAPKAP